MGDSDLTAAFIGCGNMGGAVLDGLLDSIFPDEVSGALASRPNPNTRVSKFVAYTQSARSAQNLREKYSGRHASRVLVLHSRIVEAIRQADVVVLGFKPYMAQQVLGDPEVQRALKGKLVISMLAGLSSDEIRKLCVSDPETSTAPIVAKAVPNMAARCRQSMTILELPDSGPLPPREAELTEWVFSQIGSVKWLAPGLVNAGSMLMTSCLAALSIPLEGLLDGSVVEGLRRADAMDIAVQGINGLGAMLAVGVHPAVLRESISSPRGCTIQSLLTVEKAATRAVFAQALVDGTRHLQPTGNKRKG